MLLLAANPGAEVQVHGTGGSPSLAAGVALGLGADRGPMGLYGIAHLDAMGAPALELRPEFRARLTPSGGPELLLLAGAGGRRSEGAWTPAASVGLALGLELSPSFTLRIESRYRASAGSVEGLQLGLVLAWSQAEAVVEPELVVEIEPDALEPEPVGAGTLVLPAEVADVATVWVPHPVCIWLSLDEANALLSTLPRGTELSIAAPGYLPVTVAVDGETSVGLVRAPNTGSLVVVALPGDEVLVGDVDVVVGPDGMAVLNHREGFVAIAVVGGGRVFETEVAVVSGHTLWARVNSPKAHNVRFQVDSAVLSPSALAELNSVGEAAGSWAFQVQGGASPEGSLEHNLALADRRAEVVVEALVSAGVERELIQLLPAEVRTEGDPEALRSATITPVKP